MATVPPIPALIPADAIDTTIDANAFQQSFGDIVGNTATDSDGFDALFNGVADGLSDLGNLLGAFDGDLGDAGIAAGAFATPLEGDAADTLAATITAGDPDFKTLVTDSNPNPPPAGGGSPPPPAGVPCGETLTFVRGVALPHSLKAIFDNCAPGDLVIHGVAFTQDVPGTFAEADNIPALMPAFTFATITITQEQLAPAGTTATVTVTFGDPPQTQLLCAVVK